MMNDVSLDEIESTTDAALVASGATPEVAASVAQAVRVAEERGNTICGVAYVESYCRQLRSGRLDGTVEPTVHHDRPGVVRVDAHFGFAQPAFDAGLATAVASAREVGLCGFSVEHSHTCTSLGYFTERIAREGLLAIGATNATPRVAPPGGSEALLGTNPIAMSVPDGEGGIAFQFDFATSAVALGTITAAAKKGESIPLGWAVDSAGQPTTDPKAALEGSLAPAADYKGYGIGLMVEVLAAALTGGNLSVDVPPLKAPEGPPHDLGQFYVVIDPAGYAGSVFHERIAGLMAAIAGQHGARLPGSTARHLDPVSVDSGLWDTISGFTE